MKKLYVLFITLLCLGIEDVSAQNPNLPTKATLTESILSNKTFSNAAQVDTVLKYHALPASYSLNIIAKVNSSTGRGLDIDARNSNLQGFRLSLDASSLNFTSALSSPKGLSASTAAQNQNIRVAVKNQTAYIYHNGSFIQSQPISTIKDIVAGAETNEYPSAVSGPVLTSNWGGTAPNNTGKPSDYGWTLLSSTGVENTTLFNTANSSGGSRFLDLTASTASGTVHTYNGSSYIGRIMYTRWDATALTGSVYSFPVTLEANTAYNFSMLYAYVSNYNAANSPNGNRMTVGISTTKTTTGQIFSQDFTPNGTARTLSKQSFIFTSQAAGQYYITITGGYALYSIADLKLNTIVHKDRLVLGKNYPTGAVDIELSSVTYEDGAYAPESPVAETPQTVTLTGSTVNVLPTFNTNFIVPGKTDVHFTGEYSPLGNSTVELNSDDAWLFFDNIKPSDVVANLLAQVKINGLPAAGNTSVRVAIYKNGTVLIPNGKVTSTQALEVYKEPNLAGESKLYEIETYHNNLGSFNNKIKSFKLKRGYMATLANNADGSGYSRVFIANDADLVVNTMPLGLDTTVSFIRVFRWDWVSKKGKAGWSPAKINATWYYDWNIGGGASADYDYSIIRQNAGWPSFTDINNKKNVNHVLGFNEPDRPDQANMTVDECVAQWPELMKSGLRIGSPAPANPENSMITDFLAKTDKLNYRVDFVAIHCYWGGQTPQQWYNRLKAIYNRVKRPLWITEWNNGANWTTEAWPTDQKAQFEKQYNDMKGILNVLDTASFVERYAIYDWVENKRAMVLADTLTLAGKYYAANKSDFAYRSQNAFIHTWKLVSPNITSTINNDDYFKTTLSWSDVNGELGSKYVLERKIDGRDADFVAIAENTGYVTGAKFTYVDSVYAKATYRIKAFNLTQSEFVYSTTLDVNRDANPIAPTTLSAEVLSSSKIKLTWNAATNVRSYNLKRSLSASGPFENILSRTTKLEFLDEGLNQATDYFYVVTSLNSAGESINSTVTQASTKTLTIPAAVINPHVSSGDTKVTLTWDFMYDAKYEIQRSDSQNGTYSVIAADVDALRYVDANRINGNTYFYKILAHNGAGRGPASEVLSGSPVLGQHLLVDFDEATGTSVYDKWGGFNGTAINSVTWTNGKDNTPGALQLKKDQSSYVQLAEGVVSGLNDFTIATWAKFSSTLGNNARVFDFGNSTSHFMILIPKSPTTSYVRYKITCAAGTDDRYIPYVLPADQWVHVAITQQGSSFKFYINGVLQYSDNTATVKPSDLGITTKNYLGRSQYTTDPYTDNAYDDFRIYNYALNAESLLSLANNGVLPVTLSHFTAKANTNAVQLKWSTASEQNSSRFEIERSRDGQLFAKIGEVQAAGKAFDYAYNDQHAFAGNNYYRLKQIDIDGRYQYSRVELVNLDLASGVLVYPNPATSYLAISGLSAVANNYSLTALDGRQMEEGVIADGKINLKNIDLTGIYILRVYEKGRLLLSKQVAFGK